MRKLTCLLALIVALASVAVVSVAVGGPARAHDNHSRFAGWFLRCGYAKTAKMDPIVYPGQEDPPSGHLHDFFGGTVTPTSSYSQLRQDPTTCQFRQPDRTADDRSGYWAPALYTAEGEKIQPIMVQAYSRTGPRNDPHDVTAWPFGTKLIVRASDPKTDTAWFCAPDGVGDNNGKHRATPYDCTDPRFPRLAVEMFTPNCTRPSTADSVDHRRHFAYSRKGGCPSSHPKEVPEMRLVFKYASTQGAGLKVAGHEGAMEEPSSFHADFFNAWKPELVNRLIAECIRGEVVCGEDGVAD